MFISSPAFIESVSASFAVTTTPLSSSVTGAPPLCRFMRPAMLPADSTPSRCTPLWLLPPFLHSIWESRQNITESKSSFAGFLPSSSCISASGMASYTYACTSICQMSPNCFSIMPNIESFSPNAVTSSAPLPAMPITLMKKRFL